MPYINIQAFEEPKYLEILIFQIYISVSCYFCSYFYKSVLFLELLPNTDLNLLSKRKIM